MSLIKTLSHGLLSSMFIVGGFGTFANPDYRAQKAERAGVPAARQAAILNGATMVVAGTALALDFAPKLAAVILVASLIPTTYVGHSFWEEDNPGNRTNQRIHFTKNLAMLGGLLSVLLEK